MKVKLKIDLMGSFPFGISCITDKNETKWRRKYMYNIPEKIFNKEVFEKVTSKKEPSYESR